MFIPAGIHRKAVGKQPLLRTGMTGSRSGPKPIHIRHLHTSTMLAMFVSSFFTVQQHIPTSI